VSSIGKRISNIRKERGYTQEKLAELANISIQFLSSVENDKKGMTVTTLQKIADCLNVTTDYIIYGRDTSNKNFMINAMIDTLSDQNKKKAEKLLEIFVDAINDKSE
jgi:transcriptional regulator, XRE family